MPPMIGVIGGSGMLTRGQVKAPCGKPSDQARADQNIDRPLARETSFLGPGCVAPISLTAFNSRVPEGLAKLDAIAGRVPG